MNHNFNARRKRVGWLKGGGRVGGREQQQLPTRYKANVYKLLKAKCRIKFKFCQIQHSLRLKYDETSRSFLPNEPFLRRPTPRRQGLRDL